MLALIQRVKKASVTKDNEVIGKIDKGLLIFLGVVKGDSEDQAQKLINKIEGLRIFEDENDKMNLSVQDAQGKLLVVSQFTLAANCKKGRRPSFDNAAPPEEGKRLCEYFVDEMRTKGLTVETGEFAAHMYVELINDGPVTIWLDSETL